MSVASIHAIGIATNILATLCRQLGNERPVRNLPLRIPHGQPTRSTSGLLRLVGISLLLVALVVSSGLAQTFAATSSNATPDVKPANIYVANLDSGTISVIDGTGNHVFGTISVGFGVYSIAAPDGNVP